MKKYQFALGLGLIITSCLAPIAPVLADTEDTPTTQQIAVSTEPATMITDSSATLNGYVTYAGDVGAHRDFAFGTTTSYGELADPDAGRGFPVALGPYMLNLTGLECNTTYHYIAHMTTESFEVAHGEDQSFTTLPCGVTLTVQAPESGRTYEVGDTMHIEWSLTNVDPNQLVELSYSGYLNEGATLIGNVPNTGTYDWTVPAMNNREIYPYNGFARMSLIVKYVGTTTLNNFQTVPFYIHAQGAPVATFLTPNGGESFNSGDTMHITWTTENIPADANILLVLNDNRYAEGRGSDSRTFIAINIPNTGSYDWVAPKSLHALSRGVLDGSQYTIAINYANEEGTAFDVTDAPFSIHATSLPPTGPTCAANGGATASFTSLAGGETLTVGQKVLITWDTCGIYTDALVDLQLFDSRYSTEVGDNGVATIAQVPNTGSYEWTVPASLENLSKGTLSGDGVYSVGLYTFSNMAVDYSDNRGLAGIDARTGSFSITPAPVVDVVQPRIFNARVSGGGYAIPSPVSATPNTTPVVAAIPGSTNPPVEVAPAVTATAPKVKIATIKTPARKTPTAKAETAKPEIQAAAVTKSGASAAAKTAAAAGIVLIGIYIARRFFI